MTAPAPIAPIAAAPPAPATERARLRQAAQGFEAIFVRQVLASARATDFGGSDLFGSGQSDETFTQMRDERFADIAAQTGAFGLARQIEAQLARVLPVASPPPANEEG